MPEVPPEVSPDVAPEVSKEAQKSNCFETGARRFIPSVSVYVRYQGKILMIFRNSKPGDFHQGKWNGLGGKLEEDESAIEAARRELWEESGLDLDVRFFKALGTVHFPNFKAHRSEDWLVTLFDVQLNPSDLTESQKAVIERFPQKMPEGELHWIDEGKVMELNLWPGDVLFLPAFLEGKFQTGAIWYKDGLVVKSWFQVGPKFE